MSATTVQIEGGAFQSAQGTALANGYLIFELSQDATVSGTSEVCAGLRVKVPLDSDGNVVTSPPQYIWPNDQLSPANTYYMVTGYSSVGQRAWGPNAQQVLSTPSPYNLDNWIPASTNTQSPVSTTYDIGVFFPGLYAASQVLLLLPLERTVRFAPALVPSQAACGTPPTATAVLTINQNSTQVATLTINTNGTTVFTCASGVVFNEGDVLTIVGPSVNDSTLANVGILLSGTVGG